MDFIVFDVLKIAINGFFVNTKIILFKKAFTIAAL